MPPGAESGQVGGRICDAAAKVRSLQALLGALACSARLAQPAGGCEPGAAKRGGPEAGRRRWANPCRRRAAVSNRL